MKITEVPKEEYLYGLFSCPGCAAALAVRLALKILGKRTIIYIPASCMSTACGYYPQSPMRVPMMIDAFTATSATLIGSSAGLRHRGITDINVVAIAGDGATMDIGLQGLSNAIISGYRFVYICYDNEAYMNTGVQWSSATPTGALTTTTPAPEKLPPNTRKKDMMQIVMAHKIPYAATASVSYPLDYMEKVNKAKGIDGPTYIHVLTPCPLGWGFDHEHTIEIGRMAVESGMWYLGEYNNGVFRYTLRPKRKIDIRQYLSAQRRFRRITEEQIRYLACQITDRETRYLKKDND